MRTYYAIDRGISRSEWHPVALRTRAARDAYCAASQGEAFPVRATDLTREERDVAQDVLLTHEETTR